MVIVMIVIVTVVIVKVVVVTVGSFSIRIDNSCKKGGKFFCYAKTHVSEPNGA